MRTRSILALLASALVLAACTKPPQAPEAATTTPAEPTNGRPVGATPVTLFNAFTASQRDAEGNATAPAKAFPAGTVVLVGAVLHGQAPAANVKVEWGTPSGTLTGQSAIDTAVKETAVVTLPLNDGKPLPAGSYKILVFLNGAPSWELMFDINP